MNKINKVIKFEDIPSDAMENLKEKYPEGWTDHIRKITKPNGDFFHAINVDTETVSYLVKVDVIVDSDEDIGKIDNHLIDKKAEKAAECHSREEGGFEQDDE